MGKDILIKDFFKNGDLNVGFSDEQHIEHVFLSASGHFKNNPLLGLNILSYANAPWSPKTIAKLERECRLQLEADGAKNIKVKVKHQTQDINATATY